MTPDALTIDEKIKAFLLLYGVTKPLVVDEGDKEMVLTALMQEGITEVSIDDEGALTIGYDNE